ncbi:MAG: cyclic nucleotide-binding domain-containing protein [Microcoleaceae cyanobacterium]
MPSKSDIFLELDVLKDFYTEEVDIISEYFSVHRFFDLQVIMPQKSKDTAFGIILDGEVTIMDDHLDNPSRIAGDFLGEIALLQSTPRKADYVAASDGAIAIMTFDDIDKLKQKNPHLAVKLIHVAAQSALQQIFKNGFARTQESLVLVADPSQSSNLVNLILKNQETFSRFSLLTSPRIGKMIQSEISQTIQIINPYLLVGGSNTIGSQIILGNVKALINLKDPFAAPSNSGSLDAILRLCHLYQVFVSLNLATTQLILDSFVKTPQLVSHL